jgi:hypothetical protein
MYLGNHLRTFQFPIQTITTGYQLPIQSLLQPLKREQ